MRHQGKTLRQLNPTRSAGHAGHIASLASLPSAFWLGLVLLAYPAMHTSHLLPSSRVASQDRPPGAWIHGLAGLLGLGSRSDNPGVET